MYVLLLMGYRLCVIFIYCSFVLFFYITFYQVVFSFFNFVLKLFSSPFVLVIVFFVAIVNIESEGPVSLIDLSLEKQNIAKSL